MQTDLGKRIERSRQLKRRIFELLAGTAGLHEHRRDRFALERIERVLVVRANLRLGNLLLMTPGLAALRRTLPHARIDVPAHDPSIEVLAGSPDIDGLIGVTRRTLRSPQLLRIVGDLRRQQYDLAIDGGRGAAFSAPFSSGSPVRAIG